jgi:cell wall assembly regulator SMI1
VHPSSRDELWSRLQARCEAACPTLPRGGLNPPASPQQIEAIESLVGARLPDDLREAYLRFNGMSWEQSRTLPILRGQCHWVDLETLARNWTLNRSIAMEMDRDVLGDNTCEVEGQPVRPCMADDGWLPIGASGTIVQALVDLHPSRWGTCGQVLLADPEGGFPRLMATSFAQAVCTTLDAIDRGTAVWDGRQLTSAEWPLALSKMPDDPLSTVLSGGPMAVTASVTERSPQPLVDANAEASSELMQALLPAQKKRDAKFLAWPRQLRETQIFMGDEPVATVQRCFGDAKEAGPWLKSFSDGNVRKRNHSAFALWLGYQGDGLTTLALQEIDRLAAAHRRNAQKPVPFYLDLAPLVDHRKGSAPATLAEAVGLELARRGLPDGTATVLQAVSDGRCVLFIDHVESVALYQPSVWRWPAELPRATSGLPSALARVLMLCADEYFDEDDDVAAAVSSLRRCVTDQRDEVWLATLEPLHSETSREWCAQAGFDLTNRHEHDRAWHWLGFDQATAGRIAALRPLFEQPDAPPPQPLQVFAAWWKHCLPASFELDTATLEQIAVSLALMPLQKPDGSGSADPIPTRQYAALVQHHWPDATPARQALLRMAIRVALQLQRNGNGLSLPSWQLWSGLVVVDSVEAGDLSALGMAVVPGGSGTSVADAAVEAWQRMGHTSSFPDALVGALEAQHAPEVTGALFRLVCQFAQVLAAKQVRANVTADRTQDFKSQYTTCLGELLLPLSQLRLSGASLKGARFRELPLTDIDLSGADLTAADFSGAQLLRVSLDDAIANDACFDGAVLHDVSAERLIAHRSQWRHARWNRRWPTAQLTAAVSSVSGVHPGTSDGPLQFASKPGAAPGPLRQLLRSPDGRWMAALAEDGGVGVWHGDTLAPAWHLSVAADAGFKVLTLAFSHDGARLITSHAHKSLRSWALDGGHLLQEHHDVHHPVDLLVVHPDGKYVIGYGNHQHVWCDGNLRPVNGIPRTVPAASVQGLTCAAIRTPGRTSVFTNDTRRPFGLCEYNSTGPRRELSWPPTYPWRIATVHDADAGHDWLAALAADEIWLGDPDSATPALRFERPGAVVPTSVPHPHRPMGFVPPQHAAEIAFSPDGSWLVCVGPGGPAIAIATQDGSVHHLDEDISRDARCAAFDQAGRLVLGDAALRVCTLPGASLAAGPDSTASAA